MEILKNKIIFLFKISFLIFLFVIKMNQIFALENKIALKIDNEIITTLDIENEKNYLKTLNPRMKTLSSDEIYNIAKNSLVREKIKQKELIKTYNKIEVLQETLDQVLRNVYTKLNFNSKQEFIDYLKNEKIKYSSIENKLKIEILWNRLIYLKYNNKIDINIEEIRKQLKSEKKILKQYLLQEILFELKKNENLKSKYSKISKDIENNGFEKVALTQSISDTSKNEGLVGWVNENSLNKKILNEIEKINIGNYTEPIIIPGGFLILKIKDMKIIKKEINIEEEVNKIIYEKKNQQLNQYSIIFYNKIKKNLSINEI